MFFEGISRLMILDLEAEKAVDSGKRLRVVSGYPELCAVRGVLGPVGDLAFQLLHGLHAWRDSGVNKHRYIKIALGEFYGNHRQMLTNSLLASSIRRFIALYFDSTAVCQEMEMMGRLFVTKAHSLVAPCIHARKMVLWTGAGRLAFCADAEKAQNKASEGSERSTPHCFRHVYRYRSAAMFASAAAGMPP